VVVYTISIPIKRRILPKKDGPKNIRRAIPATSGGRERGRLMTIPMNPDVGKWYRESAYATGRAITAQNMVEMSDVIRDS